MSNVIYFPGYLLQGRYMLHHGKRFLKTEALVATLSQRDWARALEWEIKRDGYERMRNARIRRQRQGSAA